MATGKPVHLRSMYLFYREHFGYRPAATLKQRIAFARAVSSFGQVLRDVYNKGSMNPVDLCVNREKALRLTVKFLKNIQTLAKARFSDPLREIKYLDPNILVDISQTGDVGRVLSIACPVLYHRRSRELLFLTFGPSNMTAELGVFRTLTEALAARSLPFRHVECYTYWNVLGATEQTLKRTAVTPAPVDVVLATCSSLMEPNWR
ncbi:MAG TPA: hypothetical protein VGL40_08435 [Bacillota bacterium]|jgi:hypothetical protein